MRNKDGRRDLSLIRASGSTARVLNLALVHERHGHTEEHKARPFFRNPRLNRALIIKHVLRAHERDLFTRPAACVTKVILPYASSELELGGVSFMVGETRFEKLMRDAVGGYDDEAVFEADAELLRLIAALPSFDPFLLRERLRHAGADPARIYFDIAEADLMRMRSFVSREIAQLVSLAFAGGAESGELAQRLADKLMTDETAAALEPLRETLKLSGEAYGEGVFAWKGFLYYTWLMAEMRPGFEAFLPRFAGLRVTGAASEQQRELAEIRRGIIAKLRLGLQGVEQALGEYGAAFKALSAGQPAAFRDFLLKAPARFIPIGEAVGVIRHLESYWRFRFPALTTPAMEADEAIEVLHEFEGVASGMSFARRRDVSLAC